MKTKQQIQDEIAELQKQLAQLGKQLEEMERKNYYYLMPGKVIAHTRIKELFQVACWVEVESDQPHGLGKFETREEAERARAALVFILDLAKQYAIRPEEIYGSEWTFNDMVEMGKDIIKTIEDGTYE